ncbi:MAG: hypothetical protein MK077_07490 [Phycisphaerales bacterium]|nr:hypothetical protein [Phycisphaerales bacterium]
MEFKVSMMHQLLPPLALMLLVSSMVCAGEHPAWTVRDAAVIIETLDIEDRESQAIIELLLHDYDQSWQELLQAQHAAIDALTANKPSGDSYLRQCFETSAQFGSARDLLAADFETGMQAFLEDEDQADWETLKRLVRRRNLLPRGQLKGERNDLYQIINDMAEGEVISQTQGVQTALANWEVQLDPLLAERAAFERNYPSTFRTLCMNLRFDDALDLATQRLSLQQAVRDRTDATTLEIVDLLSADQARSLRDQLNHAERLAGLSRITSALLAALRAWEAPDTEDKAARDQLIADWQAERRSLMQTLRQATRVADGGRTVADLRKRLQQSTNWPRHEEALFKAKLAVMQLDEHFNEQVCRFLGRTECQNALAGQPNAMKRLVPRRPQTVPFHEPTPDDATGPDPDLANEPISTEDPFPEPEPGHDPGEPIPNIEPDPNSPDPFPPPDPGEPIPDPFPS